MNPESLRLRTVLIIDPDHSIRTLIEVLLRHAGFGTHCAGDGADGISLSGGDFDVIIRDVNLAPANRDLALRELEQTPSEVLQRTVVTTTGPAALLHTVRCEPPFAVVQKPFEIESFVRTIQQCARRKSVRLRPRARSPRTSADDDRGRGVDLKAVERFVQSIPALRALVTGLGWTSDELQLCGEIRRAALELSTMLDAAALTESDASRAAVLRGSALAAGRLGLARATHGTAWSGH